MTNKRVEELEKQLKELKVLRDRQECIIDFAETVCIATLQRGADPSKSIQDIYNYIRRLNNG